MTGAGKNGRRHTNKPQRVRLREIGFQDYRLQAKHVKRIFSSLHHKCRIQLGENIGRKRQGFSSSKK